MDLDDVLNEYVSAFPENPPNHSQMTEWIREFPQYGQDIAEFTVAWCVMEASLKMTSLDPEFEIRLLERGMEVAKRVIAKKNLERGIYDN